MRFWDSSAIVPLLVRQSASPQTDGWFSEDRDVVLWTLTPVEVLSAVRRLVREGSVDERRARDAESRMQQLLEACHVVIDVEGVKSRASRLLRIHPLRTGDALQLGAALEWAGGTPTGRLVHTLDDRLALAASREGFVVAPEPA